MTVAAINVDWSEYDACKRRGCGAQPGDPCVHQKHGTAMRNPHPGRPLVSQRHAETTTDDQPVETTEDAQDPTEDPETARAAAQAAGLPLLFDSLGSNPENRPIVVATVHGSYYIFDEISRRFIPATLHLIG